MSTQNEDTRRIVNLNANCCIDKHSFPALVNSQAFLRYKQFGVDKFAVFVSNVTVCQTTFSVFEILPHHGNALCNTKTQLLNSLVKGCDLI